MKMARGLFLMGLTHDFAYAFGENQTDHEHEGGRILRDYLASIGLILYLMEST